MTLRSILAFAAAAAAAFAEPALGQAAAPIRTRNLSPPVAIFALPTWQPVPEETVIGLTMELANHYRLSGRGTDKMILDGETFRTTFHFERPFADGWSAAIEIPFYQQYGGVLDNLIDGWHSTFGLPDGGRNNRPEGELLFEMANASQVFFVLDESGRGPGDVSLSLAREFGADRGFVLRGTIELATGDESLLAGNGSTDWMVTLLRNRDVALPKRSAGYYWGLGLLNIGTPAQIRFPTEDFGVLGIAGGGLEIKPRFGIKAQIEVHTGLYQSPLEELGQTSVQATFGGWWSLSGSGRLEFAVSEDLHVSTAPDVVLHAGLSWRW
jgi:hypothetical protein